MRAAPVLRAVPGGVTRRKVQAVVIGLAVLASAAAAALAAGPLADPSGPSERAFAAQHGSEVTATARASPAQLAATTGLAGVATLPDLTVPAAVQISAGVIPALWWLAAAGTLLTRARHAPSAAGLPGGVAVARHGTGWTLAMKRVCGSLAGRYASRTIQVADGRIASGVDAGAQR